jgi:succinate dehydrogenase / fumarate reductase membrane anchor subunit
VQRLTAVALALLTPWFAWLTLGLMHQDAAIVAHTLGQPLNATLMLAFVIAVFWHARLGVQVVIEDYVHTAWLEFAAQIAVAFLCALGALVSIVAIGRLAFAA